MYGSLLSKSYKNVYPHDAAAPGIFCRGGGGEGTLPRSEYVPKMSEYGPNMSEHDVNMSGNPYSKAGNPYFKIKHLDVGKVDDVK